MLRGGWGGLAVEGVCVGRQSQGAVLGGGFLHGSGATGPWDEPCRVTHPAGTVPVMPTLMCCPRVL